MQGEATTSGSTINSHACFKFKIFWTSVAFRLLEKGTEKVLNKFLPGFGKKIGEEGFNLGTEIIDQGRKLKQSGVERLTDIVIEKKEQENNKSQNKNE